MNQAFKSAVINQLEKNETLNQAVVTKINQLPTATSDSQGALTSIIESGLVPENMLAQSICLAAGLDPVSAGSYPNRALKHTTELARFLRDHEAIPLNIENDILELAMTDPSNRFITKIIESKLNCSVKPKVAIRSELVENLHRLYPTDIQKSQESVQGLNTNSPLIRELNRILHTAASKGASDIHFEPCAQGLKIRYRVNGVMQEAQSFAEDDTAKIVARLKMLAKLDVTEKRRAQNGRFKLNTEGRVLNFRLSSLPLHNGESIVLRLLENALGKATLGDLGFDECLVNELNSVLLSQQGLLLVTGPTGSGKTTTLYSLLSSINKPELKIISIEDPVELDLENINQIQVDEDYGVDFASALKSVLRQDPDVIMVGEIRDQKTAELAAQAALTGHLVLSTLHTNSASSAITRLRNLGLPDYLIDGSLRGVLAQRLVRTYSEQSIGMEGNLNKAIFESRSAIAEYLPFREHHTLRTPVSELQNYLLNGQTLAHQAHGLVDAGKTTAQEIHRVLGLLD